MSFTLFCIPEFNNCLVFPLEICPALVFPISFISSFINLFTYFFTSIQTHSSLILKKITSKSWLVGACVRGGDWSRPLVAFPLRWLCRDLHILLEASWVQKGKALLGDWFFGGERSVICFSIDAWLLWFLPMSTGKGTGRVGESTVLTYTFNSPPVGVSTSHSHCQDTFSVPEPHQDFARQTSVLHADPSHGWTVPLPFAPCFLSCHPPSPTPFCLPGSCWSLFPIDGTSSSLFGDVGLYTWFLHSYFMGCQELEQTEAFHLLEWKLESEFFFFFNIW